jgi:hypothetical protein
VTERVKNVELIEQDGLLLAKYRNGTTARWGRIVGGVPGGVRHTERVATADGRSMRAAWVTRPGTRQSERVAWPV